MAEIMKLETVELKPLKIHNFNVGDSVIVQPYGQPQFFARVERIGDVGLTKSTEVELRRYYTPEKTVAGRHKFYGNKELLLANLGYTLEPLDRIIRVISVHSFLNYMNLRAVGEDAHFCRFEYDTEEGWLSPAIIELFCKCKMPFNPDMYSLKCEACKERYHPECINMTIDEAKELADNFTCSDCLTYDNQDSASASFAAVDL